MDIGMTIPTRGPLAEPDVIEQLARRAEELGGAYLAVPDHIVVPRKIDSRYPYSASGDFPGSDSGSCLDQFTVLTFLAAVTTTPRLVTSVTVIPHRGALESAKLVASIDVLSQGRMTLGVGAGWMREEFEALGAGSGRLQTRGSDARHEVDERGGRLDRRLPRDLEVGGPDE